MRSIPQGSGRVLAGRGVRRTRPPRRRQWGALGLLAGLVMAGSANVTHIVAPGENLTRIAKRYGTTPTALSEANHLKNPNLILAGQTLVIPFEAATPPQSPPTALGTHVVARGENLSRIASRYRTTPSTLARMNGIGNPNLIRVGHRLSVPVPYREGVEGLLERYSDEFGIDRGLIKALAWQESGWQQRVVSPAGAVGVMQVLPGTGEFTSKHLLKAPVDLNEVESNVKAGVRFFAYLLSLTSGDEQLAAAGYFQGLRSVRNEGISSKTARYVANVMALRKRFS